MSAGLRQESVVELGGKQLTVLSEVLLDPEALIVTQVFFESRVLKKHHVPVPPATLVDFEARGPVALAPCLHSSHLRFVGRLIAAQTRYQRVPASPAGVLATLVLGTSGEVLVGAGEDQVPGAWLSAVYLVSALSDVVHAELGYGGLTRAVIDGDGVKALVFSKEHDVRVCFLDRGYAPEPSVESVERHLDRVECAPR